KRSNLSNGWFLNRHAQQIAGVTLAWFVTALYNPVNSGWSAPYMWSRLDGSYAEGGFQLMIMRSMLRPKFDIQRLMNEISTDWSSALLQTRGKL
ncbi:hypothetical protein ACQKE8_18390, partial [Sphingobium limneticum]|uniref:hypothetical protein n=1 Tax=Sphingobium limneticum TaxID=1007511 RepID=UPI003D00EF44